MVCFVAEGPGELVVLVVKVCEFTYGLEDLFVLGILDF